MTEIKLTKRYPQSRTEDIVDAYMRGWNDALDAVQNGKFHIAEQTEPQTETEVVRTIIHKMIDNTDLAEDAYPGLRQRLHDAVDEYEPKTDCPWK